MKTMSLVDAGRFHHLVLGKRINTRYGKETDEAGHKDCMNNLSDPIQRPCHRIYDGWLHTQHGSWLVDANDPTWRYCASGL